MVGCRDALLSVRSDGLSGRDSQAGAKMFLHLGAIEGSMISWLTSFFFLLFQSSHPVDERRARVNLRA